ncbi:hypothetical protein HY990_07270 [Candidatus Micrarchaeota archaeon]|nr:hypothetical protein [Candidatus Micrarchaeota archaeon]
MKRKKAPSLDDDRPPATRAELLRGFQIHSKTKVAQDYLNKLIPLMFLDQMVNYAATNEDKRLESHLSTARASLKEFPTYREYLRSGLMASGYAGKSLSAELDRFMKFKNAPDLELVSQQIRANIDSERFDVASYLSGYKKILILVYGTIPFTFRDDSDFIAALDKIFNG